MSEACEALGLPVIGGNVCFYNASSGADIHPTPVVGVLGLIDELDGAPPAGALEAGESIVVLGDTRPELGGSEWAAIVHGLDGGTPPVADLDAARQLHDARAPISSREREVAGVHDVSDGGLAVALCEMAFAAQRGFRVDLATAPGACDCSAARPLRRVDLAGRRARGRPRPGRRRARRRRGRGRPGRGRRPGRRRPVHRRRRLRRRRSPTPTAPGKRHPQPRWPKPPPTERSDRAKRRTDLMVRLRVRRGRASRARR